MFVLLAATQVRTAPVPSVAISIRERWAAVGLVPSSDAGTTVTASLRVSGDKAMLFTS